MVKKVVISANNSNKALAFFAEINKKKEAAKAKFISNTARVRELLMKKTVTH